jgi:hypothetical protein
MPFVLGFLAALSAIAYWIYRGRGVGPAAKEEIDLTEDPCGPHRRKRLLQKTEGCPLAVIDDPAVAAITMLVALASSRGDLSLAGEEAIKAAMRDVMKLVDSEEIFTFACWVASHAIDPNDLSLRFAHIWSSGLRSSERADFYEVASGVCSVDGEPTLLQISYLHLLRERLGLTRA